MSEPIGNCARPAGAECGLINEDECAIHAPAPGGEPATAAERNRRARVVAARALKAKLKGLN
jgi:hypothetical protein